MRSIKFKIKTKELVIHSLAINSHLTKMSQIINSKDILLRVIQ